MPLGKARKGASNKSRRKLVSKNVKEFEDGARFAALERKFGRKKALKVAIAASLKSAGLSRKKR